MERGQREWGSRRRREGGGQREEARVTSYEQVGIIVSRMMLGLSTPQRVLHTVSTDFKCILDFLVVITMVK